MGDNRYTGHIYRVGGNANTIELDRAQAGRLVKQYHWIYANSSCKDLEEAKEEALKLSNAVGSPLILVYLSRHVFFDTHRRNTYPTAFQDSIHFLIDSAHADHLLITAKSYSVHQVLHAINNFHSRDSVRPSYLVKSRILLIGISPAFGAFGNQFSSNVDRYVKDVRNAACKYCMIASNDDGITWKAGGAARRWGGGRAGFKGDDDVGKAMEDNYEQNVKVITLEGADHPMDDYLECGLVRAMRESVNICGFRGTYIADVLNPDLARASERGDLFW